jgi:hypothetical protein
MEAHTDSPLFAERQWAELVALYVTPAQRGGDLGQRMVAIGKQWAAANGFDWLQLYVTAANEPAKRFYARCGLRPTQEIWRADLQPAPGVTLPADPYLRAQRPRRTSTRTWASSSSDGSAYALEGQRDKGTRWRNPISRHP